MLPLLALSFQLSEAQRDVLRKSWNVIYSEIGQSLCYVGGTGTESSSGEHPANGDEERCSDGEGVTKSSEHRGVAETFFRLFEEYPQSRAFFAHLVCYFCRQKLLQAQLRAGKFLYKFHMGIGDIYRQSSAKTPIKNFK